MKNKILVLVSALIFAGAASAAARPLNVVATVPELGDIAGRIGGSLVKVQTIARGTEDIHQVVMKPSFVTKLNRADAVVYLGMTVEHAYLPGLLAVASNPNMRENDVTECAGPGCVDCSAGLNVMDKPRDLSRTQGEQHPQGNPHYNTDPSQGPRIARIIAARFSEIDPEHKAEYQKNLEAYLAELEPKIKEWRAEAAVLKGVKAVSVHEDVAYIGRFTGIDFVGTLELKPGVAPTPTHLAELVKMMKAEGVKLIVREQQYDPKQCEWLAAQTGAKIAVFGTMANAFPGTETFIKSSEHNINALVEAVKK
jgi:ABC-type Zn uptake system ZnuABC Zn-binding protein ZnuA